MLFKNKKTKTILKAISVLLIYIFLLFHTTNSCALGPWLNTAENQAEQLLPKNMDFLLTEKCSLRCPICWSAYLPKHVSVGLDAQKNMLDIMWRKGVKQLAVTGGEPLQEETLEELLAYARGKGMSIVLFTNTMFLTEERLHRLVPLVDLFSISSDSYDVESAERFGGHRNFSEVERTLKLFSEHYRDKPVQIITVVSKKNKEDLSKIGEYLKDATSNLNNFRWKLNNYVRLGRSETTSDLANDPFFITYEEFKPYAEKMQRAFPELYVRFNPKHRDNLHLFMFPDGELATTAQNQTVELGNITSEDTFSDANTLSILGNIKTNADRGFIDLRYGDFMGRIGNKAADAPDARSNFHKIFKIGYELLAHAAVNEYIAKYIISKHNGIGIEDISRQDIRSFRKIEDITQILETRRDTIDSQDILIASIPGLLKNTGQVGHVGLGRWNGKPIIYLDSQFFYSQSFINDVMKDALIHEKNEIAHYLAQKSGLEKQFGRSLSHGELRQWVRKNKTVADRYHKKSQPLGDLYEFINEHPDIFELDMNAIFELWKDYGLNKDDAFDTNIGTSLDSDQDWRETVQTSPAHLLETLKQYPELMKKARSVKGFSVGDTNDEKGIFSYRHEANDVSMDDVGEEIKLLCNLGILWQVGSEGRYRLSDIMTGRNQDNDYTSALINVINNMRYGIGKEKEKSPLWWSDLTKNKISFMKSLIKLHISNYLHSQISAPIIDKKYTIKIWKGYGSIEQTNLIQGIERMTRNRQYQVSFEDDIESLINFACSEENIKSDKVVTILPANIQGLSLSQKKRLDKARVMYVNVGEKSAPYNLAPLEGLIAAGRAYLNGNEELFYELYILLTQAQDFEFVSLEDLKKDPAQFIEKLKFTLRPLSAKDYDEIRVINDLTAVFLQAA